MKVLVFTHIMGGHHLEYIHHLYETAAVDKNNNYVFLLPHSYNDVKDKFEWATLQNVAFDFFEDCLFQEDPSNVSQMLSNSYRICKYLGKYSRDNGIDVIYSNHMIVFVPFAPIFIRGPRLIGIIYRIYLHEIEELSWKQKIQDRLKYYIMGKCKVYKHILLLNDKESANHLNRIYHTDKFSYIPDPYLPLRSNRLSDIRKEYNIDKNKTLFVHFGAMNSNKGSLEIMESIRELSQEKKEKYAFFFAGKIYDDIKDDFYGLYNKLRHEVQIVLIDNYCDYDLLFSLCISCDAILTPYKRTSQSSGLIGYASQFGKPVIAPSKGLLGNLVRNYKLGLLINNRDPHTLIAAYNLIAKGEFVSPSRDYCNDNSVESFKKYILNYIYS